MNTIDLSKPRVIAIKDRGHLYRFTVSPIPERTWNKYFAGVVATSTQKGKEVVNVTDDTLAKIALFDDIVVLAEGYKGGPVGPNTEGDWKSMVPAPHKDAVINTLTAVFAFEPDDEEPISLGTEEVHLKAIWDSSEDGNMRQYSNLVHRFSVPTAEHQVKYRRAYSRSKVVGGTRGGQTYWHGAQVELVEIYDELIEEVEGYSVSGEKMADSESIALHMDAFHKFAAARYLFRAASPEVEETKDDKDGE